MKRLFKQFLKETEPSVETLNNPRLVTNSFNLWLYSTIKGKVEGDKPVRRFQTTDRGAIKKNVGKWLVRMENDLCRRVGLNGIMAPVKGSTEYYKAL